MKQIFTEYIADFDDIELLAVDTETFDMDEDNLFTTRKEKFTMDIFSVAGIKNKTMYCGAFPAGSFSDFYKKNSWKEWVFHNAIYDLKVVKKSGHEIKGLKIHDTMAMARLLGTQYNYGLKDLRQSILGLGEREKYKEIDVNNKEAYYKYASLDASDTLLLYHALMPKIKAEGLEKVYEIEKRAIFPTAEMEYYGVKIDVPLIAKMKVMLQKKIEPLEHELHIMSNYIDLNSPKQLQKYIFDVLQVEPRYEWMTASAKKKRAKAREDGLPYEESAFDYSVDVATLMDLQDDEKAGKFVSLLLQYRMYKKLLSTYIDGFIPLLEQGRVHGRFDPLGTASGRYSSSNPNLQNIASRDFENDVNTRDLFIPEEGYKFLTADYSQVELRVLALLSGEPSMIKTYKDNGDIHGLTAKLMGIPRKAAKIVGFGVIYGMSEVGLKGALKKAGVLISTDEAKQYIDNYWTTYKRVTAMFGYIREQVRKVGYVRTISGRKRRFIGRGLDLSDADFRAACNTVIQGTAADIMKVGMWRVWNNIDNSKARFVMQVHDEITLEVREDYIDQAREIIDWGLSFAIPTVIPVPAECERAGDTWLKAKESIADKDVEELAIIASKSGETVERVTKAFRKYNWDMDKTKTFFKC